MLPRRSGGVRGGCRCLRPAGDGGGACYPPDFICNQRGFLLQPVLGLVSAAGFGALRPSPAEVAEVFTAPLSFFRQTPPQVYTYDLVPTEPENFPYDDIGVGQDYRWSRGRVEVPVWYWHRHAIWGMTARLVRDLTDTLEETL